VNIREMGPDDVGAFDAFLAEVPGDDRTFFKEDVDAPGLAARWAGEERCARVLAVDDERVVAFAALVPGVARASHVADLRLVVAASARRQGVGVAVARHMLLAAVQQGFAKVTVEVAVESEGAIAMFQGLGFVPEALLRDQLRDPDGALHDLVLLAHPVQETWAAMLTGGIDDALG
jgi:ribosomal protein S18 acetylase RimI-like enzyme